MWPFFRSEVYGVSVKETKIVMIKGRGPLEESLVYHDVDTHSDTCQPEVNITDIYHEINTIIKYTCLEG